MKFRLILASLIIAIITVSCIAGYLAYLLMAPKPPVKPIKIGHLADLTGPLAPYGYSHELVLSAAIRKINAEGGIAGRPVELYTEDTETKVPIGVMRLRKLIEYYGVDFVIGSQHSGINIATNPIAKELKTIIFQVGEATETTEKEGNRYVFRINNNVRQQILAGIEFACTRIAKKWVTIVADYAWGWSNEEEFKKFAPTYGAEVLASIRAPLGTKDFLPYLAKIPKEAEGVFYAFFFAEYIALVRDLYAVRPDLKHFAPICAPEGIDVAELGPHVEGAYYLTWFPRSVIEYDSPYIRELRKDVGIDDWGKEIGTGKTLTLSHSWVLWEVMFVLKKAIEETGWKDKADNPKLIKYLEGLELKESYWFPQGDKFIRAEDHQAFMRHFIVKVEKGKFKLIEIVPIEKAIYPPEVDYTKEPF